MSNLKFLRREPNSTVVRRLIELGALREGGERSLRLAEQLVGIARHYADDYPTDAVANYLRQHTLIPHVLDDPDDIVILAGEVVDVVRAHDRSASTGGDEQ